MNWKIIVVLAVSLTCICSCSNPEGSDNRIELRITGLSESISAPVDATRDFPFRIWATDSEGYGAAGLDLEVIILTGPGEITPSTGVTGEDGKFICNYKIKFDSIASVVNIKARTITGIETVFSFNVNPTPRIADVILSAEPEVIFVPDGSNGVIDLYARVVDETGGGVGGITLRTILDVSNVNDSVFGLVDPVPATDFRGETQFGFSSEGGYGRLLLRCEVDSLDGGTHETWAQVTLNILGMENRISAFNLSLEPDSMDLPADSQGHASIDVQVLDFIDEPIPELLITFEADYGRISDFAYTNEQGIARVEYFITPEIHFPENIFSLVVNISAQVPGTVWTDGKSLYVNQVFVDPPILTVNSDQSEIFADNGITFANINAWLRTATGEDMPGEEIRFSSSHGTVSPVVVTNAGGIAQAVFRDIGLPSLDSLGGPIPAEIEAYYGPADLRTSVDIYIREYDPLEEIQLQASMDSVLATSRDTVTISAYCYRAHQHPAPDSVLVRFESNIGRFIDNAIYVTGGSGLATAEFLPGQQAGTAQIQAWATTYNNTVRSDCLAVEVLPGEPASMYVAVDPDTIHVIDRVTPSTITATIWDRFQNHMLAGMPIEFTTNLGVLSESTVLTDEDGSAVVYLRSNGIAGYAQINAIAQTSADPVISAGFVTIMSGKPHEIDLTAIPDAILVLDTSAIEADIYDEDGNNVERPLSVWFEIGGANDTLDLGWINGETNADTLFTQTGKASAVYQAGSDARVVYIRVGTWVEPDSSEVLVDSVLVIVNEM